MVVKPLPCCGVEPDIGLIFEIDFSLSDFEGDCLICGQKFEDIPVYLSGDVENGKLFSETQLKKINPPKPKQKNKKVLELVN